VGERPRDSAAMAPRESGLQRKRRGHYRLHPGFPSWPGGVAGF
jgi:hypothetical protein